MEEKKTILFLNTPIASEEEDIIGIENLVDRVDKAIDSNAQMIAITSPFGSGKTSLIELLKKRREAAKRKSCFISRLFSEKEQIVKISMWSQLQDQEKLTSTDLHRTFLYQIINQVNPRRANYIKNCLNPNNGLFALHTNKPIFWVLTVIALIFAIFAWAFNSFSEELGSMIPEAITDQSGVVATGCFFVAIIFAIVILTRARILYSFKNPENGRAIDVDEVIDLYDAELLKPLTLPRRLKHWVFKGTRYIVIIEDLDRTTKPEAVVEYLTELRKYCVPDSKTGYYNKVNFIVNIKPESVLRKAEIDDVTESLYEKIFDFILNLQTINIDNYDAILEGLLKKKENELQAIGLKFDPNNIVNSMPAMQWIIREKCDGIREIKDRLNITFSLYETLRSKFPQSDISLETCAAVSYLTTAFAEDFYALNGREFDELVDAYLQTPSDDFHVCDEILPESSDGFRTAVWQMIQSKIIDSSYRSYFYNYPKGSKLYTSDERYVINAVLYNTESPDLDNAIERIENNPAVIQDAFKKTAQLGILLPNRVLSSESLYLKTLQFYPDGLEQKLNSLDYSSAGAEKTIQIYMTLLSFDSDRVYYTEEWSKKFCKIWEGKFAEGTSILRIRGLLCQNHSKEIMRYRSLFFSPYKLISKEEMAFLSFSDALNLIDVEAKGFAAPLLEYIQSRFSSEEDVNKQKNTVYLFLKKSLEILKAGEIAITLLEFMISAEEIYPDFEREIFCLLDISEEGDSQTNGDEEDDDVDSHVDVDELTGKYKALINLIASQTNLSDQTLQNINQLNIYDGYDAEVADQLRSHGYCMDYILISLVQGYEIPFADDDIKTAIQDSYEDLLRKRPVLFLNLRELITKSPTITLSAYKFLFSEGCPVMTQAEFDLVKIRPEANEEMVMSLMEPARVTQNQIGMLNAYFCRNKQTLTSSYEILCYISQIEAEVSAEFFDMLDFDMIRYRYIGKERKAHVKQLFAPILELETAEGKMHFMERTKLLDEIWEKALLSEFCENDELYSRYIDFVNSCDKVTATTVQIVDQLPIFAMSPVATEALYSAGKYRTYISARTAWEDSFSMEDGERGEILWPEYLKALDDDKLKRTRGYMQRNTAFLEQIRNEHAYVGFSKTGMLPLSEIPQDEAMIKYVADTYDQEFSLEYYSQIDGFTDKPAAVAFWEIAKERDDLLVSDDLYNHVHDKLVDPTLKGQYTKMRKKL